jgi:hypothetical protein
MALMQRRFLPSCAPVQQPYKGMQPALNDLVGSRTSLRTVIDPPVSAATDANPVPLLNMHR